MADTRTARSLVAAKTCLGMGVFADGILFHQLLQLRGMVSARVDRGSAVGQEVNMFWNGVFHAATGCLAG